jgi:hypothetical protein
MVHLRTVPNSFHAQVIAARLGADGILTQLRGGVDSVYPVGEVAIFVPEGEFESARELLLADEVESAFLDSRDLHTGRIGTRRTRLAAALVIALLVAVFALQMAHGMG